MVHVWIIRLRASYMETARKYDSRWLRVPATNLIAVPNRQRRRPNEGGVCFRHVKLAGLVRLRPLNPNGPRPPALQAALKSPIHSRWWALDYDPIKVNRDHGLAFLF